MANVANQRVSYTSMKTGIGLLLCGTNGDFPRIGVLVLGTWHLPEFVLDEVNWNGPSLFVTFKTVLQQVSPKFNAEDRGLVTSTSGTAQSRSIKVTYRTNNQGNDAFLHCRFGFTEEGKPILTGDYVDKKAAEFAAICAADISEHQQKIQEMIVSPTLPPWEPSNENDGPPSIVEVPISNADTSNHSSVTTDSFSVTAAFARGQIQQDPSNPLTNAVPQVTPTATGATSEEALSQINHLGMLSPSAQLLPASSTTVYEAPISSVIAPRPRPAQNNPIHNGDHGHEHQHAFCYTYASPLAWPQQNTESPNMMGLFDRHHDHSDQYHTPAKATGEPPTAAPTQDSSTNGETHSLSGSPLDVDEDYSSREAAMCNDANCLVCGPGLQNKNHGADVV